MKKLISISLMILFLWISVYADEKFMVTAAGSFLMPSDKNYKEIYGKGKFYPEIKAGYKIYRDFYIWAGYGFFSARGTTIPTLNEEAESSQNFLSLGAGYSKKITNRLEYKLELGAFSVSYKEEAMEEKVTGSALGFRLEGGIVFDLIKTFFAEMTIGYLKASDTVEGISIKLGGFKIGIGFGVRIKF